MDDTALRGDEEDRGEHPDYRCDLYAMPRIEIEFSKAGCTDISASIGPFHVEISQQTADQQHTHPVACGRR
jgi:hypothetical protein